MKNLQIVLVILIHFCASALLSAEQLPESPNNEFVKEIQGLGYLVAVSQTSDEGYVTVSYKDDLDTLTIRKVSNSGERIWKNSFQSSNKLQELIVSGISELADGYLLTGTVGKSVEEHKRTGLLIKLNTRGKIVWSKNISAQLQSAIAQPDGTFFTLGVTGNPQQPVLMKFGSAGDILWSKRFAKLDPNANMHSSAIHGNGFLIAVTRYRVFNDGWPHPYRIDLTRIKANGDSVWAQTLRINDFQLQKIRVTSSGNILLIAENGFGSQVISLNKNGHAQWASVYFLSDQTSSGYLVLNDLVQTSDGGYAVVGIISPDWMCGCGDALLLKLDGDGKVLFEKKLGSGKDFSGNSDVAESIFSTQDNGYVIFGQSYEHFVPNGSDPWSQLIIGLNYNLRVSGCNSFEATDIAFIKQNRISQIKISQVASAIAHVFQYSS
jgi:PQQ-like domain